MLLRCFFSVTGGLAWISGVIARCLLLAVFVVLFLEVILRFGFNLSLAWSLEFARYAMIWAVMLSGSLLVRDRQLIAVDFFNYLWPDRARVWRDIIYQVFLLAVLAVLFWTGYKLAMGSINRTTPALQISWVWVHAAIPVGVALMMIQMLHCSVDEMCEQIRRRRG